MTFTDTSLYSSEKGRRKIIIPFTAGASLSAEIDGKKEAIIDDAVSLLMGYILRCSNLLKDVNVSWQTMDQSPTSRVQCSHDAVERLFPTNHLCCVCAKFMALARTPTRSEFSYFSCALPLFLTVNLEIRLFNRSAGDVMTSNRWQNSIFSRS